MMIWIPFNDCEGEKRKKSRKDIGEPSFRSSKKDKAPMDSTQKYIHSGSTKDAKRKTNWFDMLLKSNIDQNVDCILGLSTFAVAKKIKEIIKKDELTIVDLEGVGLEMLKRQYKNDVELEYHQHMSKSKKPHNCFYNSDFYYLLNLSTREKYTTSLTKHFAARYHTKEDARKDFFKAEMGNRSSNKVYSNKRIIFFVKVNVKKKWGYSFLMSIVVRRSDNREYEFRSDGRKKQRKDSIQSSGEESDD
ncbi:hypothetical protein Tco_0658065, partial [Tanacetum coccineum]